MPTPLFQLPASPLGAPTLPHPLTFSPLHSLSPPHTHNIMYNIIIHLYTLVMVSTQSFTMATVTAIPPLSPFSPSSPSPSPSSPLSSSLEDYMNTHHITLVDPKRLLEQRILCNHGNITKKSVIIFTEWNADFRLLCMVDNTSEHAAHSMHCTTGGAVHNHRW